MCLQPRSSDITTFFNVCARPYTIKNFNKELRFRPTFVIIRFVDIS